MGIKDPPSLDHCIQSSSQYHTSQKSSKKQKQKIRIQGVTKEWINNTVKKRTDKKFVPQ